MKVELTPDAEHWVRTEVEAGTFETPEDAVRYAIRETKRLALLAKLDAAVAEGGGLTAEEVMERIDAMFEERREKRNKSSTFEAATE